MLQRLNVSVRQIVDLLHSALNIAEIDESIQMHIKDFCLA